MIYGGPESQPPRIENKSEAYLAVSALQRLIIQSSLLKFQKQELQRGLTELTKQELQRGLTELTKVEDKINLPTHLVVRAVVEGLLGISFGQLSPEEQKRIEHELQRYGAVDFDTTKA